ncbi:hypothetical protein ACOSQ3_003943 [Xanthoceras sorbifolium]
MGLAEHLSLISRGLQPIAEYLDAIRDIADELALVGAPIPNKYLITHTLNGVDTVISFDKLHGKLVEYEAFLKWEELCSTENLGNSTGNLSNIIANAAHFLQRMEINTTRKISNTTKETMVNVLLALEIVKATILAPIILETIILVKIPLLFVSSVRSKVIPPNNITLPRNCFSRPLHCKPGYH